MEHAVALDDHLRIVEHQVAVSERPEVRLPPAEDDRHDVDRHVVDEPAERANGVVSARVVVGMLAGW
jgi:hypothetical protein